MSKKLIYLMFVVLVLVLVNTSVVSGVDLDTDPNLVGWCKFDEGFGDAGDTTADSSGNENTGTLYGPVEWTDGHEGAALKLTGPDPDLIPRPSNVETYVRIEYSPELNPTEAITIMCWINPNWTGGNNRLLQKGHEGSANQCRFLKEGG